MLDSFQVLTRYSNFSLSGDESAGKDACTICLQRLKDQLLGRPNCCAHVFCAECIIEWSQNVATCPIDRLQMKAIAVTKDGKEVSTTVYGRVVLR